MAAKTEKEWHPMRGIVDAWDEALTDALEDKRKPFQEVADECIKFFNGRDSYEWLSAAGDKGKQSAFHPRFKFTLHKAFELVAIFGPLLYNRNPVRTVTPREPLEMPPELLGDPNDPQVQQMVQQAQMQTMRQKAEDDARAQLLSRYLNYTPNEMPGGGLKTHAEKAITEALIKGAGVLWTSAYTYPGDDMTMPVSRYDTVDNLLIDPDAETLDDAKWISHREYLSVHDVSEEFGIPVKDLLGKGDLSYYETKSSADKSRTEKRKDEGKEKVEMMYIYRNYSRMGIGTKLRSAYEVNSKDETAKFRNMIDKKVGKYAYIVTSPNISYPLNLPKDAVNTREDEEIVAALQWPVPFWADERWPMTLLSFYEEPRQLWPVAPLAPGLGELKFLNVMMSHLASRIWSSSRDFIAVAKAAAADLEDDIRDGNDQTIIRVSNTYGDIRKVVTFLQQPQTNFDVWKIIEAVVDQFERRVGLTDLAYGLNTGGTQSRTAEDAANKNSAMRVRPDHMADRVETWMTEVARHEAMVARMFLEPEDLEGPLGPVGASLWQSLVMETSPIKVMREMEYRVESGSARKPNKDQEVANAQQAMQLLGPEFSKHADATTDTNPLNALVKLWAEASDSKDDGMQMGPRMPPPEPEPDPNAPPPPEVQMAQMDLQAKQMDLQAKQMDSQMKQQEFQFKQQEAQANMQMKQVEGQSDMQMKQQQAQMDMQLKQQAAQMDAQLKQQQEQQKALAEQMKNRGNLSMVQEKHSQDLTQDQLDHLQEMNQDQDVHDQDMLQSAATHHQGLFQSEEQSDAQVAATKKQAAAKPKTNGKPSGNGSK